jgi:hypothetical protein
MEGKVEKVMEDSYNYDFPTHLALAFSALCYEDEAGNDYEIEEAIEAFASRWGGVDLATFRRVLEEGTIDDKVLAIFAIGFSSAAEARELLVPFLHSDVAVERWASAYCLGLLKDERAVTPLQELLLHLRSPEERPILIPGMGSWYDACRRATAYLFGEWGPSSVVPVLRRAFKSVWELEQTGFRDPIENHYQDALAYALGQRGVFGAFTGLDLSPLSCRLTMIHIAQGYLRVFQRHESLSRRLFPTPELQQEIAAVLEERFGLTPEESIDCVKHYSSDYFQRDEEAATQFLAGTETEEDHEE